ncbi:MAG: DUF5684 domain-containing protein [Aureispira sp.]
MQSPTSSLGVIVYLLFIVFYLAGFWKVFEKAGKPGWASLIPLYNAYVLTKIADRPAWYLILFFVPIANIFAACSICNGISIKFGKGMGYTLGLIFLGFIFFPVLGFGNAQYDGYVPDNFNSDLLDDELTI